MCSTVQKFGPKGVQPNRLMPAYGLAENTLFVSGRQVFDQQVSIIRIDANKMRDERMIQIVDDVTYKNSTSSETSAPSGYQRLVGCGPCSEMIDGREK